jgi:hypothetical protein
MNSPNGIFISSLLQNHIMKNLMIALGLSLAVGFTAVSAQDVKTTPKKAKTETATHKTKVKPTSTTGQKVHNAVSSNNKYSGAKVKSKNKKTNKKHKVEVHHT